MYLGWWPIRTHDHFCTFQAGTSERDKRDQCQDDDGHTRIWPQSCCISSQSNLHEVAVRQDATISDVPNNLSTNAGLEQLLILISQGHVIEGRVSFANLVANQRQEWWAGFHYDLFAAKLRCWILLEICEHVVLARSCFFVRLHNYRSRYFYRERVLFPKILRIAENFTCVPPLPGGFCSGWETGRGCNDSCSFAFCELYNCAPGFNTLDPSNRTNIRFNLQIYYDIYIFLFGFIVF